MVYRDRKGNVMHQFNGFRQFFSVGEPAVVKMSAAELVDAYLNHPDEHVTEIARRSGYALSEFYRTLRRAGVTPCRLKTNQHLVSSYHNAGYNVSQIAELTGYTARNVRYILKRDKTLGD